MRYGDDRLSDTVRFCYLTTGLGFKVGSSMQAPLPAVQIANTFVVRFGQQRAIDHLKLQKLSYFAYGWWLALRPKSPQLANVRPQVWKLGPVFHPIYSAFVGARFAPITQPRKISPFQDAEVIGVNESDESKLIEWIWQRYGQHTGEALSEMTHQEDTPWYTIARRYNFEVPRFLDMPDDENRTYFDRLGRAEGIIT